MVSTLGLGKLAAGELGHGVGVGVAVGHEHDGDEGRGHGEEQEDHVADMVAHAALPTEAEMPPTQASASTKPR